MRILWLSRVPWSPGGYSNQTAVFAPRLQAAGHPVAIAGWQQASRGVYDWRGIPVLPTVPSDPRNELILERHYEYWGADLMISLHDAEDVVDGQKLLKKNPRLRWALWCPIDSEPLSSVIRKRLTHTALIIVFSRFAERVMREAAIDTVYVPHGIDTQVYRPCDRAEARRSLGWPNDKFIVGIVAANQGTRKAYPQNLQAFARFHAEYPDSSLYVHAQDITPRGLDLSAICLENGLKVGEDVFFCDSYEYFLGFSEQKMAMIYNALDVMQLVTKGEGFGLPIIEAQACGTPVIVGDWSAMSELLFAGWRIEREQSTQIKIPGDSTWRVPKPDAIADRLAQALGASRDPVQAQRLRLAAREGALRFDADHVTREFWLPLLDELEERFHRET